jgi:hypothetical protein
VLIEYAVIFTPLGDIYCDHWTSIEDQGCFSLDPPRANPLGGHITIDAPSQWNQSLGFYDLVHFDLGSYGLTGFSPDINQAAPKPFFGIFLTPQGAGSFLNGGLQEDQSGIWITFDLLPELPIPPGATPSSGPGTFTLTGGGGRIYEYEWGTYSIERISRVPEAPTALLIVAGAVLGAGARMVARSLRPRKIVAS